MKNIAILLLLLFPVLAGAYFYLSGNRRTPPTAPSALSPKPPAPSSKPTPDSVLVKLTDDDLNCHIEKRPTHQFSKRFAQFYQDPRGEFFVKSFALQPAAHNSLQEVDILVRIPKLDSSTFRTDGMYIMDSAKVICVFGTSDGGEYVEVKHADPRTFKSFRNVFGGKDKSHVFYEYLMIEGLRPQTVKVYSETHNCANCDGYFKDGDLTYFNTDKMKPSSPIPRSYKFTE